jgi:uncharacterized protein YgbK (DUF1537 family)
MNLFEKFVPKRAPAADEAVKLVNEARDNLREAARYVEQFDARLAGELSAEADTLNTISKRMWSL